MNENWIKEKLKQHPCKVLASGNIRTCPVRLSFPNLFEAKAFEDGDAKFSASLLFPKGADLKLMLQKCVEAANEQWGTKWKTELPSGKTLGQGGKLIHFPFRDGGEREDKGGYEAGAYFVNVNSNSKPGVVDARARPVTDEEAIYPGVWALVTLRAFAYDAKKRAGVSLGLQNVQKLADDEPLGGVRAKADEEFDVLPDDGAEEDDWSARGDSLDGLGNLAGL